MLKALLLTARPRQWTKNLLVYFALFFTAGEAWDLGDAALALSLVGKATLALALFSLVSSAQYLVNDVIDAERDRRHPKKRLRPVASGALPPAAALTAGGILAAVGTAAAFAVEPLFGWTAAGYMAVSLAYSLALKRFPVLDVFAVSAGFVIRAVAGAVVIQAPVSPWLYVCTGLGSLLIALSKRRSELVNAGDGAGKQRDTLDLYTIPLLDQLIGIAAAVALMAYTLYTFTAPNLPQNGQMMLTTPFVAYGVFRYLYLIHRRNFGEDPEEALFTDAPLAIAIALWLATAAAVLLGARG